MPSRITFVLNSCAGADAAEAEARLSGFGPETGLDTRVVMARTGGEVQQLARKAVREHSEVVVAGGGDGTVNAVASAVVDSSAALGVLPLGTLNHFAKDLGIPLSLPAAARTLLYGRVARVDVGEVNGRIFLNNSSLGLYPRIVEERAQEQRKGWTKWMAYAEAVIAVFREYPLVAVRLLANGREFCRRTPFLFVGNNRYVMEGVNVGERARLDAGELLVCLAGPMSRGKLLWCGVQSVLGQAIAVETFSTTDLRVETTRRRVLVALDGEVCTLETPLHYRIRPGALRVIVPAGHAKAA